LEKLNETSWLQEKTEIRTYVMASTSPIRREIYAVNHRRAQMLWGFNEGKSP
jgi:hypothetical protein